MKKNQKPKKSEKPKPYSKTRHDNVLPEDLRTNRLVVFMSDNELDDLHTRCTASNLRPAEFIRTVVSDKSVLPTPAIIPPVNIGLARDLGRSLGNLSTIASTMRKGAYVEFDEIAPLVTAVQNQLKGLKYE